MNEERGQADIDRIYRELPLEKVDDGNYHGVEQDHQI